MRKKLYSLLDDKELKEQKAYEKIQRACEKKDRKSLERWIRQFATGKDDWLS
jgi:hypothetical protein